MCILPPRLLSLLLFCITSVNTTPEVFIIQPYQTQTNTLLQITSPTYLNINDCLHIESQASWQTIQVIATKIDHWHRFEIRKDGQGLFFLGDLCK